MSRLSVILAPAYPPSGIFVTVFLLPVSFLYDIWWSLTRRFELWIRSSPERHDERVRDIQEQVRAAKGTKMCTARPGTLLSPVAST